MQNKGCNCIMGIPSQTQLSSNLISLLHWVQLQCCTKTDCSVQNFVNDWTAEKVYEDKWDLSRSSLTHRGRDKMAAIFQTTFSNEISWMKMYEFRLRFHCSLFLRFQINNTPALDQIMAWHRPSDKPLSEPMVVSSLTHICVDRPQWVNRDLGHMFILTRHEFSGSMLQEGLPVSSSLGSKQGSLLLVLTETIVENICYVTWPANGVSKYNARHYLIANMYAMIYHSTAFVEDLTYMSLFYKKKKRKNINGHQKTIYASWPGATLPIMHNAMGQLGNFEAHMCVIA